MGIRLFPKRFLSEDSCFGLFRAGGGEELELPITLTGEGKTPLHVVHSDPEHLAMLAAMLAVQAWVYGIDEIDLPPLGRRPVLVVTDHPGRFAEAYLKLGLPKDGIDRIWAERRKALWAKRERATNPRDRIEYLDKAVPDGTPYVRLHNLFPAKQLLHLHAKLRPIASREHMGRGDVVGAAVIVVRASRHTKLQSLEERFQPFLVLVDADAVALPETNCDLPTLVYHDSIFAPELASRSKNGQLVVYCLPDAKFESFCSRADLVVVEPDESDELTKLWEALDGALFALMERSGEGRPWVLRDVCRNATRIRSVLLSLVAGIETYEQALAIARLPESSVYQWSVTEPFEALRGRLPEVGAVGEWEDYVFSELVRSFTDLVARLRNYAPKSGPVVQSTSKILDKSRRVVLVAQSSPCAQALSWIVRLPAPFGFGLDENRVRVLETKELSGLSADQDCIVPHAFDPYDLLPTLARLGPRGIEVIVLKNELRFLGEKFLRTKQLFPGHPSGEKILRPLYDRVESLPEIHRPELPRGTATLFSDSEFEIVARMFSEGLSGAGYETVLGDDIDRSTTCGPDEELEACLVRLEGNRAVYLEKDRRFTFINQEDALVRGRIDQLEAGDRLILIKPEAREDIADRVLGARREEESTTPAQEVIASWRDELRQGIERLDLTNLEILRRIQAIGSQITSAPAIAQWCDGRVLGPQDAHDIRRIGEVLQSTWLAENWKRVGAALFMIRTGHRVLGQRVSRIIEAAALGEYTLSSEDEEFLEGIGVAFLQLQDAVVDVTVEGISDQSRKVPAYQIGTVIGV